MQRCVICLEPMSDQERESGRVCVICAHRTTAAGRSQPRPLAAGVIDTA